MPEIITRAEAREKGLKRYRTAGTCKHGHVAPDRLASTKQCCECNVSPERKERRATYRASPEGKALIDACNATHYQANKAALFAKRTRPEDKAAARARSLKRDFGITPTFYDYLLALQGGTCALCKKPERPKGGGMRSLAVEHCHDTGRVRGLVCFDCNTALGKLGDTAEHLRKAHRYLAGVTITHPLQALLDLPQAPDLSLQIPTSEPQRPMVWGCKSGPDSMSSWEVLTRLEKLRDGPDN